jgi:hypothetical protein
MSGAYIDGVSMLERYPVRLGWKDTLQPQRQQRAHTAEADEAAEQRSAETEAEQLPGGGCAEDARRLPGQRAGRVVTAAELIRSQVVHDRGDRRRVEHLRTREQHGDRDEEVGLAEPGGGEGSRPGRRPEDRLDHQTARAAMAAQPRRHPDLEEDDHSRVGREREAEDARSRVADLRRERRKSALDLPHADSDEDHVEEEHEAEAPIADDRAVTAAAAASTTRGSGRDDDEGQYGREDEVADGRGQERGLERRRSVEVDEQPGGQAAEPDPRVEDRELDGERVCALVLRHDGRDHLLEPDPAGREPGPEERGTGERERRRVGERECRCAAGPGEQHPGDDAARPEAVDERPGGEIDGDRGRSDGGHGNARRSQGEVADTVQIDDEERVGQTVRDGRQGARSQEAPGSTRQGWDRGAQGPEPACACRRGPSRLRRRAMHPRHRSALQRLTRVPGDP